MKQSKNYNLPWVTFKLAGQYYAVNSGYVVAIDTAPDNLTEIAYSSGYIRGVMEFRNGVIPLADMRILMGIRSIQAEEKEFMDMLEGRKQDHINWVETLRQSVLNGSAFVLATDPHKCAFGRWYDNYETDNATIRFYLNKIDEPHQALHACADDVLKCKMACEHCSREICSKIALKKAMEEYMPTIVALLEDMKQVFSGNFRGMSVILQNGDKSVGLLVDEVSGVEELEFLKEVEYKIENPTEKELVNEVARRLTDDQMVLVLDGEATVDLITARSDVSFVKS